MTQTYIGIAVTGAVLVAAGIWGYPTTRGNGIPTYHVPYRAVIDCMRYNKKTGRTTMRLVIENTTARPLHFRGNVIVAIRRLLPTIDAHGRHNWRALYVSARTPLVTIAPHATYRWSRVSRPVLVHGSTKHLEAGSCGLDALPPRMPS